MFVNKNRIKLLSGIILFLAIPAHGCSYLSYYGPPTFFPVKMDLPVDLSKAGNTAETELKIIFNDSYELYLEFFYEKKLRTIDTIPWG